MRVSESSQTFWRESILKSIEQRKYDGGNDGCIEWGLMQYFLQSGLLTAGFVRSFATNVLDLIIDRQSRMSFLLPYTLIRGFEAVAMYGLWR